MCNATNIQVGKNWKLSIGRFRDSSQLAKNPYITHRPRRRVFERKSPDFDCCHGMLIRIGSCTEFTGWTSKIFLADTFTQ
jgi:hypothetical protein